MARPRLLSADVKITRDALNKLAEAHARVHEAKDTLALRNALERLWRVASDLHQFSLDAERRAGSPELQRHEPKVLEIA